MSTTELGLVKTLLTNHNLAMPRRTIDLCLLLTRPSGQFLHAPRVALVLHSSARAATATATARLTLLKFCPQRLM